MALDLKLVPVILATLILPASVIALSCQEVPAITAAVVGEVQCVEAELAKGQDTFEDIALACAPLAVSDVVTIVTAIAAPSDAGASPLADRAAAVHHKPVAIVTVTKGH